MNDGVRAIRRIAHLLAGRNTHPVAVEIRPRGERGMVSVFLSVRVAHLAQGAVVLATGYLDYLHPSVAAMLLAAAFVESAWVAWRVWTLGTAKPVHAVVDVLFGVVGLLVAAYAIPVPDRTTSFNWMLPYSVGGGVLIALATPLWAGCLLVLSLAAAYLVSVSFGVSNSAPGTIPTAIANALSYPLFYGVGVIVALYVRRPTLRAACDEKCWTILSRCTPWPNALRWLSRSSSHAGSRSNWSWGN